MKTKEHVSFKRMYNKGIIALSMKMIARKIRNKMVSLCGLGVHLCNRHSLQSTIWMLVLTVLVGTVMISSSLDRRSQLIMEEIENEGLQDQFKLITTTKKPQAFNPFVVPKKPVHVLLKNTQSAKKLHVINWYNPPPYLRNRPDAINCGFDKCQYKNCNLTFGRKLSANPSVLFHGRWVLK
ncbi:uncharacterized protein LOC132750220, partial [Ruditapes philippinarum]|uniref:uncharacterized protein LOC132750220 n=1 Tax=Ruditapes philippinarum TaxID=129788 RepID=UPI00295AB1F3